MGHTSRHAKRINENKENEWCELRFYCKRTIEKSIDEAHFGLDYRFTVDFGHQIEDSLRFFEMAKTIYTLQSISSHKRFTYVDSCHRWIGHVCALQFKSRIQPKWHGEAHVHRCAEVHKRSAQIVENFLPKWAVSELREKERLENKFKIWRPFPFSSTKQCANAGEYLQTMTVAPD